MFGQTPAERAQSRLQAQQLAERALGGKATPDQVTQLMDLTEHDTKTMLENRVVQELRSNGVSAEGAKQFVKDVEKGGLPDDLAHINTAYGGVAQAIESNADSMPLGKHSESNWHQSKYSPGDVEAISKFGKYLGRAGSVAEVALGIYEWQRGAPADEVAVKTGASILGGLWTGARVGGMAGSFVGPEGALIAGFGGAVVGGMAASGVADSFYKWVKYG